MSPPCDDITAWFKTKDFSKTFPGPKIYFEDLYGIFHNAYMMKIYYLNEENCLSYH